VKALVVYESMFGNTRDIALRISLGVSAHLHGDCMEVGDAPLELPADLRLLVVGGPTHAFTMSKPETRSSAADDAEGPLVSSGIGIREWIDRLAVQRPNIQVAAFDTKIKRPPLPGSAAKAAHKRLTKRGLVPAARPATFYVEGSQGPLAGGELDRAERWGEQIAALAAETMSV